MGGSWLGHAREGTAERGGRPEEPRLMEQYLREASDVWGYTTECGGINRGDPPRGVAPRGVPEVDPDTRGCITHTLEHVRKYCHYFTGGAKRRSATYRQPSLGMVVTYTHKTPRDDCPIRKVMFHCSIWKKGHLTVKRGSRDFPSMYSGLSMPAMSSIVGAKSMASATASVSVPGMIPGPRIIRGTL